jgi:hypothetical protein
MCFEYTSYYWRQYKTTLSNILNIFQTYNDVDGPQRRSGIDTIKRFFLLNDAEAE